MARWPRFGALFAMRSTDWALRPPPPSPPAYRVANCAESSPGFVTDGAPATTWPICSGLCGPAAGVGAALRRRCSTGGGRVRGCASRCRGWSAVSRGPPGLVFACCPIHGAAPRASVFCCFCAGWCVETRWIPVAGHGFRRANCSCRWMYTPSVPHDGWGSRAVERPTGAPRKRSRNGWRTCVPRTLSVMTSHLRTPAQYRDARATERSAARPRDRACRRQSPCPGPLDPPCR